MNTEFARMSPFTQRVIFSLSGIIGGATMLCISLTKGKGNNTEEKETLNLDENSSSFLSFFDLGIAANVALIAVSCINLFRCRSTNASQNGSRLLPASRTGEDGSNNNQSPNDDYQQFHP